PSATRAKFEAAAALGPRRRLDPARLKPHVSADQVERLRKRAVELPRIPASNPTDAVGVDARREQPDAGVDCRLSRSNHGEAVGGLAEGDESVGRDEPDAGLDSEVGDVSRAGLGMDADGYKEPCPPPQ